MMRPYRLFLLLSFLLLTSGCESVKDPAEGAVEGNTSKGDEAAKASKTTAKKTETPTPKVDPQQTFVEGFSASFVEQTQAYLQPSPSPLKLETRLKVALSHEKRRARKDPVDLHFRETLSKRYKERNFKPIFTQGGVLKPAAFAAVQAIRTADEHALDPERYHLEKLEEILQKVEALTNSDDKNAFELSTEEQTKLVAFLKNSPKRFNLEDKSTPKLLLEEILKGKDSPLPRLRAAFKKYEQGTKERLFLAIELEVKLADGYVRFTRDMSHGNLKRLTKIERKKYKLPLDEPLHPRHHSDVIIGRLHKDLETFAKFETELQATEHIQSLWPLHNQYKRLLKARKQYQVLVAAGGWGTVKKARKLKPGRSYKRVLDLKQRLALEGHFNGETNELYDDDLVAAIKSYQEVHQMVVSGKVNQNVFWISLNIPAERRLLDIEINLKRWRLNSHMIPSDHYVYINVPDFHAEVWKDGELETRFRIVVGNTKKVCNPKSKTRVYANATPLQHARLTYMIFNPYWYVPPRIEKEDYLDKIAADPNWLNEHGFEYATTKGGVRVLRQKPGPGNALGVVKFLFPNKHNTYMHDTASKGLFRHPVRAFSHGCMRVHEPMKFAKYLTEPEGKWDEKAIKKAAKNSREKHISLKNPLDVFVDYNTIRIDDKGRPHFLADIYKYVKEEIHPTPRGRLRCTPEPPKPPPEAVVAPLEGETAPGVGVPGTPPTPEKAPPALPTMNFGG